MELAYLMFENLAESLNTMAKALLEEQQGMGVHRLDYLFIYLSIVAFTKTLALNCELVN